MCYKSLVVFILLFSVSVLGCGSGGGSASDPLSGGHGAVDTGGDAVPGGETPLPGSAVLSWNAPGTNTDGSPLTDLAGFKVYYGTSSGNYAGSINVGMVTAYSMKDLSPGTYYITVTAYNAAGNESIYANEVSKDVL